MLRKDVVKVYVHSQSSKGSLPLGIKSMTTDGSRLPYDEVSCMECGCRTLFASASSQMTGSVQKSVSHLQASQ